MSEIKYLLCPGTVISTTDFTVHRVSAGELARLYGVSMSECRIRPEPGSPESLGWDGSPALIPLHPMSNGNYTLPKHPDQAVHDYYHGPVWNAFGLSRSSYAVFPRRALQSMPAEWQQRLVNLLDEMHDRLPAEALNGRYVVNVREGNRFGTDPMRDYRHTGPVKPKDNA